MQQMTCRVTAVGHTEKLLQMYNIANLIYEANTDHMHHKLSRANKSSLLLNEKKQVKNNF